MATRKLIAAVLERIVGHPLQRDGVPSTIARQPQGEGAVVPGHPRAGMDVEARVVVCGAPGCSQVWEPPNGARISCGDSSGCAQAYVSFRTKAPSAACAC